MTFEFAGDHQAVVYDAGTAPEDITVPAFPPNFFVTPPFGLTPGQLAKGPLPGTAPSWTADVFDEPGRYLVICNITPHFDFFNMYGWVIVK